MIADDPSPCLPIVSQCILRIAIMCFAVVKIQMIAADVRIEDVIKSETGDAFLSDRMGADLHDDAANADVPPLFRSAARAHTAKGSCARCPPERLHTAHDGYRSTDRASHVRGTGRENSRAGFPVGAGDPDALQMFAQTGMATGDQLTKHLFHIFPRIDIRPRINMSAHDDCSLHQRILDVTLRFRIAGDEDPVSADPPAASWMPAITRGSLQAMPIAFNASFKRIFSKVDPHPSFLTEASYRRPAADRSPYRPRR